MTTEIQQLKATAGPYRKWALKARKSYINLRLRQDPQIQKLYARLVKRLAKKLTGMPANLQARHLKIIDQLLKEQAGLLSAELTEKLTGYIKQASSAGVAFNQAVMVDLLKTAGVKMPGITAIYERANIQAIEVCWARTNKGLYLSDRIWKQGENYRNAMTEIIQEAVATGQDAVTTARALETYVKAGRTTLASSYPNMMERMGTRIPQNISYEALRLARTEMTAAFGEGTIAAAKVSPSNKGIRWILSKSHPITDICDEHAAHDEGLGKGVFPVDDVPLHPAHPNCLCSLVNVNEQPEDFIERLKRWEKDPASEPEVEAWYQNTYKKKQS